MIGVAAVYAGLAACGIGALSLVYPLRLFGIRTRGRGALVFLAGAILLLAGLNLPSSESRAEPVQTALDEFSPRYQFHEVHHAGAVASCERVYQAIKTVGPEEIPLFRALTAVPRLGRRTPESIVNAPARRPILETATRTGFWALADRTNREVVIGTLMPMVRPNRLRVARTPEAFKDFDGPGVAKITMNFLLQDAPGGCRISTETRVYATDAVARRRFGGYWRVIYPGSATIRRMWLRAIRARAEA